MLQCDCYSRKKEAKGERMTACSPAAGMHACMCQTINKKVKVRWMQEKNVVSIKSQEKRRRKKGRKKGGASPDEEQLSESGCSAGPRGTSGAEAKAVPASGGLESFLVYKDDELLI